MKNYFLLLLLPFFCAGIAQTKIRFSYDEAGNQILRTITFDKKTPISKKKEVVNYQKFDVRENFSYYPNPVSEDLFLKWNLIENKPLLSVGIFTITGSTIQIIEHLQSINEIKIPFQNYQQGVYILKLNFENGDKQELKIIKK